MPGGEAVAVNRVSEDVAPLLGSIIQLTISL